MSSMTDIFWNMDNSISQPMNRGDADEVQCGGILVYIMPTLESHSSVRLRE